MFRKAAKISTNRLVKLYLSIISSIAFYPTILALGLFGLSLLTLYIDNGSPDQLLGMDVTIKNILDPDSARSLLGAIAGGMISLMVFSFSMVMVILSQTSSSYSPRLLPNLVGRRHHQIVLGFYLGTIAYTFVILSSIQSRMYPFGVPSLSVITNAALSFVCLGLFISFINNVSQNIQIGNIIRDIHLNTLKGITYEIENEVYIPPHQLPDMSAWFAVPSPFSGYLNGIDYASIAKVARGLDITLKVCVPIGRYVNQRDIILLLSRSVSEEECGKLFRQIVFLHQENVSQNYVYGFKQLSEIATKALSPGINDPGTALQALDRLSDLFIVRTQLSGYKIKTDKQEKLRVVSEPIYFRDLLYFCLGTIMNYAAGDLPVNHKLIQVLGAIARNDDEGRHTDIILSMLDDLVTHFMNEFSTHSDKYSLSKQASQIIRQYPGHPTSVAISHKITETLASRVG
ncbi:DUF2254 domain-containing protein [Catalinimonas niigatensis]|uniref:DUF2254 domain-containing protein n=1 Tax=Catalinimonas niigatensis TaxID=1397264 RepID=UPI0026660FBE|nr:DUF2254 domain-containing protein [Catalinimonas niigatensis]WPP48571.1 DUF2254 domain-containing protein [Catalinimonas niigatensis]